MRYNVHHYVTFRIKKTDIEALSPMHAVQESIDDAWETAASIGSQWGDVSFAEEQTFALVDEVGDASFINSVTFNQQEIYHAKSRNQRD